MPSLGASMQERIDELERLADADRAALQEIADRRPLAHGMELDVYARKYLEVRDAQ